MAAAAALLLVLLLVLVLTRGGEEQAEDPGNLVAPTGEAAETAETAPSPQEATPPAPPMQPFSEQETFRPGDEGERVLSLQQALTTLGHDPGEPDGVYGPATEQAVRSFQEASGLPADGIAGPNTLRAINEALAERG